MINNEKDVKDQYAKADRLTTRISIHDKYSTNKMGFANWIYSNYRILEGMKVLELGCGTGSMWKGHEALLDACGEIILSDFSEGMVETSRTNLGSRPNTQYRVIDIQDIPYEDETFDVVIANMMLYHVPDLDQGLREVRRVLKKTGVFYTATYGEHGIVEYMASLLGECGVKDTASKAFTLQNGGEILGKHFSKVEMLRYEDSLAVTDVDDLVDYAYSLGGMTSLSQIPRETLREVFIRNMKDGVLSVPKEYGMFVARPVGRDEKSCGAIVFTYENGVRKYVMTHGTGIYQAFCGFPKGHMDAGETEQETALREVKEETGLDVVLIDGFREVDEHFLAREGRPNDKKTNVHFLAEYHDQELKAQASEISQLVLMNYEDAMQSLTSEESKRELAAAERFLNEKH